MAATAGRSPSRRDLLTCLSALGLAPGVALAGAVEPSPAMVMAHPEQFDPFTYATVVKALWTRGDRLQAAFWFYLFQVRSRPWAMADKAGDSAAALRASLNDVLGQPINGWIGGDLDVWKSVAGRAVSYDRRLPLPAARPSGLTAAAWLALVNTSRAEYAGQMTKAFADLTPEIMAAERKKNGLPERGLDHPGAPLPDSWR